MSSTVINSATFGFLVWIGICGGCAWLFSRFPDGEQMRRGER